MDERGLVERVDSLTAAVADLGFKLDTLISSTTAFRESFGERMTDYADLVAHWSIETEENLKAQRRTVDRALAAQDEAVARLAAMVEGVAQAVEASGAPVLAGLVALRQEIATLPRDGVDLTPAIDEVRRLRENVVDADALSAVLAEVAAVRKDVGTLPRDGADLTPVIDEVRGLRENAVDADALAAVLAEVAAVRKDVGTLRRDDVDLSPVVAEVRALRDDMAAAPGDEVDLTSVIDEVRGLRENAVDADALAAVLAEVAAVRKDVAKLPRQATDVTPLLDELRRLREVLSEADVDDVEDEVSFAAALGEQLAALRSDVAALANRPTGGEGKGKADPAVVEAIVGLRADLAALREQVTTVPPVPPEVTALTDALQALRSELEHEPADATVAAAAPGDDRLEETLAELVYEVRALRRRFPVRPSTGEGDDEPVPAPRRRRRTTTPD
ncbi:MAG TPA: hypothetical protein VM938_12635 [Acidimicrobiales bacterium]|nr:hypothetical protein [Acidimicrobiales bacterium]